LQLTLLSRAYCHLCDEMESALRPLLGATPLVVVDVDAAEHAELDAKYGDVVPVLFLGTPLEGRELCRYRLDEHKVIAALKPQMR
jgi:hypothetical protein